MWPCIRVALPAVVGLVWLAGLTAQEKESTIKGKVQAGLHRTKLTAGNLYLVKVEGAGFRPNVNIQPGYFTNPTTLDMGDTFLAYFVPQESREHRITVLPSGYDDLVEGALDFTMSVKPVPLDDKPLVSEKSKLTATDAIYKSEEFSSKDSHFKPFPIKLKAKMIYIIDMQCLDKTGDTMDPYLLLEDSTGKIVARDDDGGMGTNARLVFQPRRDGDYRIVATTAGKGFGNFSLVARGQKE
jgi:hypothetical protein